MTPVDHPRRLGSIGPPTTAHDNIVCGQSFYWLRSSPIVPDRWTPVRPIFFWRLCLVVVASALFFTCWRHSPSAIPCSWPWLELLLTCVVVKAMATTALIPTLHVRGPQPLLSLSLFPLWSSPRMIIDLDPWSSPLYPWICTDSLSIGFWPPPSPLSLPDCCLLCLPPRKIVAYAFLRHLSWSSECIVCALHPRPQPQPQPQPQMSSVSIWSTVSPRRVSPIARCVSERLFQGIVRPTYRRVSPMGHLGLRTSRDRLGFASPMTYGAPPWQNTYRINIS
jgi:hypothetical protein